MQSTDDDSRRLLEEFRRNAEARMALEARR
jgi:hypothetical protein